MAVRNVNILFAVLLFSLLTVFPPSARAEDDVKGIFSGQETILKGLRLAYRLRVEEAVELFSGLEREFPSSPGGMFYKAAVRWGVAESGFRWKRLAELYASVPSPESPPADAKKLLAEMEKTVERCRGMLKRDPDDFEALFYMAGAYGFSARIEYYGGNYFHAMLNGKKAADIFRELFEKYPERGDALLGPGVYKYYVGRSSPAMRWILSMLGLAGTREEGLGMIEGAYEKGILSSIEAADFITRIFWKHEGDYRKALEWAGRLREKAPESPLAYYHMVNIYHRQDDVNGEEAALRDLLKIAGAFPEKPKGEWEPLLLFALGTVMEKKGEDAHAFYRDALSSDACAPWLRKEIELRLSKGSRAAVAGTGGGG